MLFLLSVTITVNSLCMYTYIGEKGEEKDRQRGYDALSMTTNE